MPRQNTVSTGLIAATAAGAIAGALLGGPWIWLHYACKPLATVLLIWLAASASAPVSARYRGIILLGLFFSLVGDVCLMLPADLFLPGLVAFLLAHLCYIAAFAHGSDARMRLLCIALFAVFGGANLYGLLPRLPADMRVPVLVYVAALVVMAGLALARSRSLRISRAHPVLAGSARAAATGAALFVLSDTLLAWNRFGGGIPLASLWVLSSYFIAQWYIARSVDLHTGGQ